MDNETSTGGNVSGFENIYQSALKLPGASHEAFASMPSFSKAFTIEPSDLRDSWHQLVIIGNGFDLECGLRSRFVDFFQSRLGTLKAISGNVDSAKKNAWYESLMSSNLTAWDFMLADERDGNWCDIEATIASWIVRTNKDDRLSTVVPLVSADAPLESFGNACEDDRILKGLAAYVRMADKSHVGSSYSREDFCCFLLSELHRLEGAFSEYLGGEVANNEEYTERARGLLLTLISQDRPKDEDYFIEDSVLSFNYTRSAEILEVKDRVSNERRKIDFTNIHGRLSGEIVFGIDGGRCADDALSLPFTKTYRLMVMGGPDEDEVIHAANRQGNKDFSTDVIKFYGHSLGEADYSYFQAIFDSVGLYNGHTKLLFYWRRHSGKSAVECANDMSKKAFRLLSDYGRTLENKDHGRNLIHKLLLEGRLAIKQLPKEGWTGGA